MQCPGQDYLSCADWQYKSAAQQTDCTNQLHQRRTVQISCKKYKNYFSKNKKNLINKLKFIEKNFKNIFFWGVSGLENCSSWSHDQMKASYLSRQGHLTQILACDWLRQAGLVLASLYKLCSAIGKAANCQLPTVICQLLTWHLSFGIRIIVFSKGVQAWKTAIAGHMTKSRLPICPDRVTWHKSRTVIGWDKLDWFWWGFRRSVQLMTCHLSVGIQRISAEAG